MVTNECESPSRRESCDETEVPARLLHHRGGSPALPVSDAHALLADERRRTLLYHLRGIESAETTLDSVVEHLAGREHVQIDGANDEETRESLHVSLIHTHIPKLERAAVIHWNERDETLRYRGDPALDSLLNVSRELELQ